jgi:hypothetical protein
MEGRNERRFQEDEGADPPHRVRFLENGDNEAVTTETSRAKPR